MIKAKPKHAPMTQFPVRDNQLVIGGIPVTELAEKVGQTPFYVYDKAVIKNKYDTLRRIMPADLHIHYAIKANPMPELVQYMAGLVEGFDLASVGEMRIALTSTMPVENISFAGPGKTSTELKEAIDAGVTINMESEAEMDRITAIANQTGQRPRVAIRVNPDFELKTSGMKMGGGPKQFGVDAERVPDMLRELGLRNLEFIGFHIYSGSQNLKHEAIIEAQNKTFDLAIRLTEHAPAPVQKLNIGGGLGIPYFPGEKPLNLQPIADNLEARLADVIKKLDNAKIITELGRYLVGEAGVYISRVIEHKISRGETFLITDGGLHHHLAASGNFGQVIRKNYPVFVANKMNVTETETSSVVGPLCTPLDILAEKMELPHAEEGDLIAVMQSGAYGFSASPHNFLSHPEAKEILV